MKNPLFANDGFTILDGGLGTMLQAAGLAPGQPPERMSLEQPEKLTAIHRAYVQAGARVLCANTFGSNAKKLAGTGISVEAAVQAAVACAREAGGKQALVALDVGPLGELLQPGGTLAFEEAYALFAQVMRAGEAAGADLIFTETMGDLYEVKAAVLAAVENTRLPVLASMTFEADGRSFTGVPVEAFAAAIGPLGPVALGVNCSLGPVEVMPVIRRLCAATPLPVLAKPNAGLPNPATGAYTMGPEVFAKAMEGCMELGVSMVGGCCGTTPDFIRLLAQSFAGKKPADREHRLRARVCGATRVTQLDGPVVIGERINPTGKKRLREALQAGDLDYAQTLAAEQEAAGADILDVNVGAPGVNEVELLPRAVRAVQAVSGLPLMLDCSNVEALAAALRVCIGRPVVNSTTGEQAKMDAVLPLCRRYGAAVVGLALDENGIPETAEKRLAVAERILENALRHGLGPEEVWIDCLTMSVGAQADAGAETLRATRLVGERLGLKTVLGVSNVSFGLPQRPLVNRGFLAMAMANGLDAAIMNPADSEMMDAFAAARMLAGAPGGAEGYLARAAREPEAADAPAPAAADMPLDVAVERGLKAEAAKAAESLLAEDPNAGLGLVDRYLIPALDRVGKGFEEDRLFLPQLLAAAGAAQAAFEVVRSRQAAGAPAGPPVVLATVQGDIHDLGKNIARVLLENYGFAVTDLGRDVPPEQVVEAAKRLNAGLVGLSALMTTTLPAMEATIKALHHAKLPCKVLVGGAVLTEAYARQIGADFYAKDAKASADYARRLLAK